MPWIAKIKTETVVELDNYTALKAAWPYYREATLGGLIASFVVRKPLTDAQRRRLPVDLRELVRTDESSGCLEGLFGLEAPRGGFESL